MFFYNIPICSKFESFAFSKLFHFFFTLKSIRLGDFGRQFCYYFVFTFFNS